MAGKNFRSNRHCGPLCTAVVVEGRRGEVLRGSEAGLAAARQRAAGAARGPLLAFLDCATAVHKNVIARGDQVRNRIMVCVFRERNSLLEE